MYTLEDGTFLVKLARTTIREFLVNSSPSEIPPETPNHLHNKSGAFVTLRKPSDKGLELRGCIGIVLPIYPLVETVIKMAIAAATQDPRFPRVQVEELPNLIVEVSCLTPPEEMITSSPSERLEGVNVGRDGLIVERNGHSGLLLPQVPIEWGWGRTKFLQQTCVKAGLPPSAWMDKETTIKTFQAKVFTEKEPEGKVEEAPLSTKEKSV
ncbi:MAG: TIGR00296 family protein [Candidatus Ranarchaeia archaeon]|jgi:uncharacterized protein (TIGR00296 family)